METSSFEGGSDGRGAKVRAMLRARLGEDVYTAWFNSLEFDAFDGKTLRVTVPVTFLRTWIRTHYAEQLLTCCQAEFKGAQRVEVQLRQPGGANGRPANPLNESAKAPPPASDSAAVKIENGLRPSRPPFQIGNGQISTGSRSLIGGFEGSPLEPRYTFDSFVVGPTNRMAHAGALQAAETVMSLSSSVNPLFIHANVGLGKTHLLQAIAWDARRRAPQANVLYITAELFRYQFVEALRTQSPSAFKERFRSVHMLLIDDLEFLQGERTELEFDHIINALLDGGRQVVVASSRAPSQVDRLNERMRSRLQQGLVVEITPLDYDLRMKVLERRIAEKRAADPSFQVSRDVQGLLAERLTENGRELEGAVTRLHFSWQCNRTPITVESVETALRDLVQDVEPRRIKIEDILRLISRKYGVSKNELLSKRRHRAIVWPRQLGMYLAKQLTARSLPEIGRRFGDRDHTTVLHAIRKIEGELVDNSKLRDELDELKKLLNH